MILKYDIRTENSPKKSEKVFSFFFSITFKLKLAIFSSKFSLLPKTIRSSDAQYMFDCEIHVEREKKIVEQNWLKNRMEMPSFSCFSTKKKNTII